MIETNEYRDILKTELSLFNDAENLAKLNKRYTFKTACLVVKSSPKLQVVCGNFASFRSSTYNSESVFHPEYVALDMYSSELDGLTFYISKLNIKNEPLPSRPCNACMAQLRLASEITHIVYRNDKLRIVKEVSE